MSDTLTPYRGGGGAYLSCPRCGESMLASGGSFVCGRDCGEWVEISSLHELDLAYELGARSEGRPDGAPDFPASALQCPACRRQMESRAWGNALFELCISHGIWLAARFRSAFHLRLQSAIDDEREVRALADRLVTDTPAARRELARRLLSLERRTLALERRAALLEEDQKR